MAREDIYEDYDQAAPAKDALGNGLVILTFLVLLVAVWFMQRALGDHFNAGLFAKKGGEGPPPADSGTP
jgi:hypothetical protein